MRRPILQLRDASVYFKAPIICSGDIFDRWNSPPELINFAISELPEMYAIPGQHDLPNHSIKNIKRSAFWTLVGSGVVKYIPCPSNPHKHPRKGLVLHPFPWGTEVTPIQEVEGEIHLAVIHDYFWVNNKKYPGAPEEKRLSKRWDSLSGYDAVLTGDNHKGFLCNQVMNCGTFMRRKIDEIGYEPFIGLLLEDGSWQRMYLNCSEDKFIDIGDISGIMDKASEATEFIKALVGLGRTVIDFAEAVNHYCKKYKVDEVVESMILEALEK